MKLLTFILWFLMTSFCCSLSGELKFIDCQDPILDSRSSPLSMEEIKDPKMQLFFDAMFKLARGEQTDQYRSVLVGLAAPQVGNPIRVILVDVQADGKGSVSKLCLYINPEILELSEETEEWYEGCYSTGEVRGVVKRPKQVKIRALDRNGNEFCETHSGYVARIFQHEIDHLNGIRFPERVPENDCLHLVKSEQSFEYRNQQKWREWKVTIPQKEWRQFMTSEFDTK